MRPRKRQRVQASTQHLVEAGRQRLELFACNFLGIATSFHLRNSIVFTNDAAPQPDSVTSYFRAGTFTSGSGNFNASSAVRRSEILCSNR
jgi:hypothetical protein